MKQEERKRQTTRQLLDAAKALIREQGCESITMKDMMERSGLSKGAIFHYVNSKDEIFAWVLQEKLEETNRRFQQEIDERGKTFEGPMSQIASSFSSLEDQEDITNKVLVYLLGKEREPAVAEVLQNFYGRSLAYSQRWIEAGQEAGVIRDDVDAEGTAELFVLISLGLRVRSSLPDIGAKFGADEFTSFIRSMLKTN